MASQFIGIFTTFILLFLVCGGASSRYTLITEARDEVIMSKDYPGPYPCNLNNTWEWRVKSGQWGIVFQDFNLGGGGANFDWLEVVDSHGVAVKYTMDRPPLLPFRSDGPNMVVRFITDDQCPDKSRGLKLHIIYGASDRDLELKIHEASNKRPKEDKDKDNSSNMLLIIIIALIVLIFFVVTIVIFFVCKRYHDKHSANRNAFGVRRNSGISHSRRSDRSAPGRQQQNNHHQQEQQQQEGREGRPVQRSNSQLNWMARAELNPRMQASASSSASPKPNLYTSTAGATETGVKATNRQNSNTSGASNSYITPTPASSRNATTTVAAGGGTASASASRQVSRESAGGDGLDRSLSSGRFNIRVDGSRVTTNVSATHVLQRDMGEYCDTADSLVPRAVTTTTTLVGCASISVTDSRGNVTGRRDDDEGDDDEHNNSNVNNPNCNGRESSMISSDFDYPPSYDQSVLCALPPPRTCKKSEEPSDCYANVFPNKVCSSQSFTTTGGTNIYINTSDLTSGSANSLDHIDIDSASCTIGCTFSKSKPNEAQPIGEKTKGNNLQSECGGNGSDGKTSGQTSKSRSPVPRKRNLATGMSLTPPASTVQLVDGYAYLVPTRSEKKKKEQNNGNAARSTDLLVSVPLPEPSTQANWKEVSYDVPSSLPAYPEDKDGALDHQEASG